MIHKIIDNIIHLLEVFWLYKLPNVIERIGKIVICSPLKEIILIESHNDFDMNGGAFYEYLLKRGLNKKYKIVWLLRKKRKNNLPQNVTTVPLLGPSFRRVYYQCVCRYAFFDNNIINKMRKDQIFVYLGHATRAMKDCRGLVDLPHFMDYIISSSEKNNLLMSEIYNVDIKKFLVTGFPVTDLMYGDNNELFKITKKKFKKVIMWMPTFRKSKNSFGRIDGNTNTETGLPLITNVDTYMSLEKMLNDNNILLIIKLHPAQDMSDVKICNTENIIIATPQYIKEKNINTYKLLSETDALVSDYSSISFDYLLIDKPIAYVLSDLSTYKLGFAVDNPFDYMAGDFIYNYSDFQKFIYNVALGLDNHKEERDALKNIIHAYQDGKSSERIVQFLGL